MKLTRILAGFLVLLMVALPLVACDGETPENPADTTAAPGTDAPVIDTPAVEPPTVYRTSYDKIPEASDELIDQLWNATQTKIDGIMNAANELTPAEGGTVYYVSSLNGNDKNDGLSPETAWKTLDRVTVKQRKTIVAGDVVAFERGSIFYNYTDDGYSAFKAKSGVTYTAYGEGEKPIITAALGDVADPSYWKQLEENPSVWYTTKYVDHLSVGNIAFNDGEYMGEGVFLEYIDEKRGGKTINGMTGLPYSGPQDLHYERQFQYIYESGSSGTVYLYSSAGNPGELYDSIHFGRNLRTINAEETEGVVLDNLSIRYASVGVMMDNSKNFTMKNCEIAYVGGSLVEGAYYNGSQYCRWDPHVGNGTVVDGSCDGIYIYDNYVHHVYEEAFSTYHNEGQPMLNLHYTGNVIMYCRQAVSLRGATEVSDVEWSDNHVWYTGYEYPSLNKPWFGEDGGAIEFQLDGVGGNLNFHMKNNVVAFASAMLSDFDAGNESYQFENNIYIGEDTCYMRIDGKPYHWDDSAYEAMKTIAHDETAEMYVVRTESDYQSERTLASMSLPSNVKAGDTVTFGAYEQDNDASNGAEAIEWIVLEVKDGKALLLSKYVLDVHYFYPSDTSLYWGLSSIREFFESDFIERAFTDEETAKMNVVNIHMVASNKYGEETPDTGDISRIFLLTAQELIGYLGKDGLAASATEYALNRTGFGNNIPVKDDSAAYWTMNFGKAYNKFVGYITVKGEWDQYGSYWWRTCNMGLRPAMWITVG